MIYKNLKRILKEKGVTIYRLEKDLGFSSGSIIKWEHSEPSAIKVKHVAEYLGVSIDELVKEGD